jgi:hypothetical protein
MWMAHRDQASGRITTTPPKVVHELRRFAARYRDRIWPQTKVTLCAGHRVTFVCYGSLNALAKDDFLTFSEA